MPSNDIADLRFDTIDKAISSWEMARQTFGNPEEVGMKIMLNLFRAYPECKKVFGFEEEQEVEDNPLLRMGVLVHSKKIIDMLDGTIAMLGPDMDMLEKVLAEQGSRHKRKGLSKRHYVALGDAVRKTLSEVLEAKHYTKAIDQAWKELFRAFAYEMGKTLSRHSNSSGRNKAIQTKKSKETRACMKKGPSKLVVRCYSSPPRGTVSGL